MKRLVLVLIAAFALVAFVACKKENEAVTANAAATAAAEAMIADESGDLAEEATAYDADDAGEEVAENEEGAD